MPKAPALLVTTLRRLDAWLLTSAPAERLAVLRVLTGVFAVGYLVARLPVFLDLADGDEPAFRPVGVVSVLSDPLPGWSVTVLVIATLALGVAFVAGYRFAVVGPVFAIALLVLTTYRSSWGQLLYFENLMVLHILVVGFAPSADALAWRRRDASGASPAYGGPLRLAALITVVTYVLAGVAKLRIGGVAWMDGDTLRNHVAFSAARLDLLGGTPSPVGEWVVAHGRFFTVIAVATMVIELGAPLALAGMRVRAVWVMAAWLLHAGIAALMFVVFPYPLFLVAFAPLFPLERLVPRRGPRRSGGFGGRNRAVAPSNDP